MARKWSDEEIEFVRKHAPYTQCSKLVEMVNEEFGKNFTLDQLYRLKYRLDIRSPNAGQYKKGKHFNRATEFYKGHVPWNKGIHFCSGGRSIETQFKKGNISPTHRPVGSERLEYGKVVIKIAEPNVWEQLSVLIWQSVHKKPFPKGYVIRFANGDITDYSPENLVAITKSHNMRLNHLNLEHYDPDSLKAACLIADIRTETYRRKRGKKSKDNEGRKTTEND